MEVMMTACFILQQHQKENGFYLAFLLVLQFSWPRLITIEVPFTAKDSILVFTVLYAHIPMFYGGSHKVQGVWTVIVTILPYVYVFAIWFKGRETLGGSSNPNPSICIHFIKNQLIHPLYENLYQSYTQPRDKRFFKN